MRSVERLGGWHPYAYGVSVGEAILWTAFAGFLVFWVYYWRVIFDYSTEKIKRVSKIHVDAEKTAGNLGELASLFTSLVLFPLSRTSLFVEIFGVPFDRCMK